MSCPPAPSVGGMGSTTELVLAPQDPFFPNYNAFAVLSGQGRGPSVPVFTNSAGVSVPLDGTGTLPLGWWMLTTKGAFDLYSIFWHIELIKGRYRVTVYAGYQKRARDIDPRLDIQPFSGSLWGIAVLPYTFTLDPANPDDPNVNASPTKGQRYYQLNMPGPDGPEYLSEQQKQAIFVITKDSKSGADIAWNYYYNSPQQIGIDLLSAYGRFVKLANPPEIETQTNSSYINNENPVSLLNTYLKQITLLGNPQFSVQVMCADYLGHPQFAQHVHNLLTMGVKYSNTTKGVWVTRDPPANNKSYELTTTFTMNEPVLARVGADATVTGFTGAYAVFNSTPANPTCRVAYVADNIAPGNSHFINGAKSLGDEYFVEPDNHWMLTLAVVSPPDLPPYNPVEHGVATIVQQVGPIGPGSGYRATIAAVNDIMLTYGRSTHSNLAVYCYPRPMRLPETFADLAAALLVPGGVVLRSLLSRQRIVIRSPWLYSNTAGPRGGSNTTMNPANDPTGMDSSEAKYLYDITIGNYLDPLHTYNLLWRLEGPPTSAPVTTQALVVATGGYYKTPGSRFAFKAASFYEDGEDDIWSLYGDSPYGIVYGLVDLAKSKGVKRGYLYLSNVLGPDPAYSMSTFKDFSPGLPANFLPNLDAFAVPFAFFKEQGVTDIIINNRNNTGGFSVPNYVLACFFGELRPGFVDNITAADENGSTKLIPQSQFLAETELNNYAQYISGQSTIDPDLFPEKYRHLQYRNQKANVVILTGTSATSSGDLIVHFFRNNDAVGGDYGNLGGGVRSFIVGSIDGRDYGSSGNRLRPFSNESAVLKTGTGLPVAPFTFVIETLNTFVRAGKNTYQLCNQHPTIKPDDLVNDDHSTGYWRDVGLVFPYPRNPINGGNDPRVLPYSAGVVAPNNNDPSTWRDYAFETALTRLSGVMYTTTPTPHRPNSRYATYMVSELAAKRAAIRPVSHPLLPVDF